jgi:hypothetical protein
MKRPTSAEPTAAARWKIQSECRNLHTDILSARCIVDRLRTQTDPGLIARVADRDDVKRITANVGIIAEFLRSIEEVSGQP